MKEGALGAAAAARVDFHGAEEAFARVAMMMMMMVASASHTRCYSLHATPLLLLLLLLQQTENP